MRNGYLSPNLQGLRRQLECFDEDGKYVSGKHWSIANGGYDCWWEIYYDRTPIIHCIAGILEPIISMSEQYQRRLIQLICDVYGEMEIRTE